MTIKALNIMLLISVIFFTALPFCFAQSNRVSVGVSAFVVPSATVKLERKVREINISEKEIERGYVVVEDAAIIEIDSKYIKSFALSYELIGDTFRTVWAVDQSRKEIQIGRIGIFNYPNRRERTVDLQKLSFKFYISDDVEPGGYPWPLRLSIIP